MFVLADGNEAVPEADDNGDWVYTLPSASSLGFTLENDFIELVRDRIHTASEIIFRLK